jgi:hypothetical protein
MRCTYLLIIFLIIIISSCNKKSHRKANLQNDTLIIINKALGFSFIDNNLIDVKRTKDVDGKYKITSSYESLIEVIKNMNNDSIKVFSYDSICLLKHGQYFFDIRSFKYSIDSAQLRINTDCIYRDSDTCMTGIGCGGVLKINMIKNDTTWIIKNSIGASN